MKKQKLDTYIRMNNPSGTKKLRELLAGKIVEIISRDGGHNYGNIGDSFIISDKAKFGPSGMSEAVSNGNNISYRQLSITISILEEDLEKDIKKNKEKIEELNTINDELENKLTFMQLTQADVFREEDYKIFKAVELIENSNISKEDRILQITKIINKN